MSDIHMHRPVFADHAAMLDQLMAPGRLLLDYDGAAHILLGFAVDQEDPGIPKAVAFSFDPTADDGGVWRPGSVEVQFFRSSLGCVLDGGAWSAERRRLAFAAALASERLNGAIALPTAAIEPETMLSCLQRAEPVTMHESMMGLPEEALGLLPICRVETLSFPGVFCLTNRSGAPRSTTPAVISAGRMQSQDIVGADDSRVITALRTSWAEWQPRLAPLFQPMSITDGAISRCDRAPDAALAYIAEATRRPLPQLADTVDPLAVMASAAAALDDLAGSAPGPTDQDMTDQAPTAGI